MNAATPDNEILAARAFSSQSAIFDKTYSDDTIIQYKRERVRAHVNAFLAAGSHILELNAGTGEDAIYFSEKGHTIHATDISEGMQSVLAEKINKKNISGITYELCSYTSLNNLNKKGPYDLIFSNFAGLNCTDELNKVLASLPALTKPGAVVTLVVLPKFCLWEFLLIGKGKIKTALRRFAGSKGARSHIEGTYFTCWYYNPSYIKKCMEQHFDLLLTEGLCTIVPPSYIEGFAEKYPKIFRFLKKQENHLRYSWPWRSVGDYYIISFRKK